MKKMKETLVGLLAVKSIVIIAVFMLCVGGFAGSSQWTGSDAAVKKYKEYDDDELLIYHRNLLSGTYLKAMKLPKGKWTKVKSGKNKGKYYFKQKKNGKKLYKKGKYLCVKSGKKEYLIDDKGYRVTGWVYYEKKMLKGEKDRVIYKTKKDAEAVIKSGKTDSGEVIYYASNGVMTKGFKTINGERYYFNPMMVNGIDNPLVKKSTIYLFNDFGQQIYQYKYKKTKVSYGGVSMYDISVDQNFFNKAINELETDSDFAKTFGYSENRIKLLEKRTMPAINKSEDQKKAEERCRAVVANYKKTGEVEHLDLDLETFGECINVTEFPSPSAAFSGWLLDEAHFGIVERAKSYGIACCYYDNQYFWVLITNYKSYK